MNTNEYILYKLLKKQFMEKIATATVSKEVNMCARMPVALKDEIDLVCEKYNFTKTDFISTACRHLITDLDAVNEVFLHKPK